MTRKKPYGVCLCRASSFFTFKKIAMNKDTPRTLIGSSSNLYSALIVLISNLS